METRWLDQVLWLEERATKAQRCYYFLRLLTIIGGVIVSALVAFPCTKICRISSLGSRQKNRKARKRQKKQRLTIPS
ncbi:DUF4231 domain-containing protein [Coleofasciculus sp. C1-SOL-03]|uniref:DUF4231 domain-containing protein n=1 Tax=Coleofasciculus sp. C1-SOL-03 TaxID=3069522 RepID=UPI00406471A7